MRRKRLPATHVGIVLAALLLTSCSDSAGDDPSATGDNSAATSSMSAGNLETAASDGVADPKSAEGPKGTGNGDESVGSIPTAEDGGALSEPVPSVSREDRPTYTYDDAPPPAEEVEEVLCDLDQGYLESLRQEAIPGGRFSTERMQTSALRLSDRLGYWIGLSGQYPDFAEDVERARQVGELWENALTLYQQGDAAGTEAALSEADEIIAELPEKSSGIDGCID